MSKNALSEWRAKLVSALPSVVFLEAKPQRTKYHDQSPQGGYRQFLNIDITGETVGELGAIWRSKFHSDSDRSLIVA